jgi:hypothetical protein
MSSAQAAIVYCEHQAGRSWVGTLAALDPEIKYQMQSHARPSWVIV